MSKSKSKLFNFFWYTLATLIILFATALGLARYYTPQIIQDKAFVEKWAGQVINRPIQISNVQAEWFGWEPEFRFSNVNIRDRNKHLLLHTQNLTIRINIFQSLLHWRLIPRKIILSGAEFSLWQQKDGSIRFEPEPYEKEKVISIRLVLDQVVSALLAEGRTELDNISIRWHGNNGFNVPISLSLNLYNTSSEHAIKGDIQVQQKKPTKLHLTAKLTGDSNDLTSLNGKSFIQVKNLQANQWLSNISFKNYQIHSGQFNSQIWLMIRAGELHSIQTLLSGRTIKIKSKTNPNFFSSDQFSGHFFWQRLNKHSWQLILDKIYFSNHQELLPTLSMELKRSEERKVIRYRFFLNLIPIDHIVEGLSRLDFVDKNIKSQLKEVNPYGILSKLTFDYQIPRPKNGTATWQLKTNVSKLQFKRLGKIPGVSGLGGTLYLTPRSGAFDFASDSVQINFGKMFKRSKHHITPLGKISWEKDNDIWKVQGKDLNVQDQDLRLSASFTMMLPGHDKSPTIDLQGRSRFTNISHTFQYLPLQYLSPKVIRWLKKAILSVKSVESSIIVKGRLRDFPFDKKQGEFEVKSAFEKLNLQYLHDWPKITDISGMLTFRGRKMSVHASQAKMLGMTLTGIVAKMPTISRHTPSHLFVNGRFGGQLSQGMNFIKQSPLKKLMGTQIFSLNGPFDGAFDIDTPIHASKDHFKINGTLKTSGAHFELPSWKIMVDDLVGAASFTESGLYAKELQGRAFNAPLAITLDTIKKQNRRIFSVKARGQIDVKNIYEIIKLPQYPFLKGKTSFELGLMTNEHKDHENVLTIKSMLEDIVVDTPHPYHKQASEKQPLDVQIVYGRRSPTTILMHYRDDVTAYLKYKNLRGKTIFDRGTLALGSRKSISPKRSGLSIVGKMNNTSWETWKAFLDKNEKAVAKITTKTHSTDGLVRYINLNFNHFYYMKRQFKNINIQAENQTHSWKIIVKNADMDGTILLSKKKQIQPIQLYFNRLRLYKEKGSDKNSFLPKEVPPINANIKEFIYNNKGFGEIALQTKPNQYGMTIQSVTAKSSLAKLTAKGEWTYRKGHHHTKLMGEVKSQKVGELLHYWGITENLKDGQGEAEFNLNWEGTVSSYNLPTLNGESVILVRNGRIEGLSEQANEKLGIGRLLNLLSLRTLARRLRLDFSDLVKGGYSFDIMQGEFSLKNGKATTNKTFLNGPVAYVSLQGVIDLVKQDYQLKMRVAPYLTSSLPAVATIAGGPIAGAVTWAVNKLFTREIGKLTGHEYEVTGSWDKPTIKEIKRYTPSKNKKFKAGVRSYS